MNVYMHQREQKINNLSHGKSSDVGLSCSASYVVSTFLVIGKERRMCITNQVIVSGNPTVARVGASNWSFIYSYKTYKK